MTVKQLKRYSGKIVRFSWPADGERRVVRVGRLEVAAHEEQYYCRVCIDMPRHGGLASCKVLKGGHPQFTQRLNALRVYGTVKENKRKHFGFEGLKVNPLAP